MSNVGEIGPGSRIFVHDGSEHEGRGGTVTALNVDATPIAYVVLDPIEPGAVVLPFLVSDLQVRIDFAEMASQTHADMVAIDATFKRVIEQADAKIAEAMARTFLPVEILDTVREIIRVAAEIVPVIREFAFPRTVAPHVSKLLELVDRLSKLLNTTPGA